MYQGVDQGGGPSYYDIRGRRRVPRKAPAKYHTGVGRAAIGRAWLQGCLRADGLAPRLDQVQAHGAGEHAKARVYNSCHSCGRSWACGSACVYACMCVCVHVYVSVYVCIYDCVYVSVRVCVCVALCAGLEADHRIANILRSL